LALFLVFSLTVESTTLPLAEYYALQNLSASLGEPTCTSSCTQCESWEIPFNVQCTGGSITYIFFQGTSPHLHPTIPSQIGSFSQLTYLELDLVGLEGTIPSQIGNLYQVQELSFGLCKLSGTIPSQIGNARALEALFLNENDLSGTIPSQIGLLRNLTSLLLSDNQLTGEIPSEIGDITDGLVCNVWFGNSLTCDPNYSTAIKNCMGTAGYRDYDGLHDGPDCTSVFVTFSKFPNARIVRVQYRVMDSKGGWESVTVDGTKTSAQIHHALPNTTYQYRLIVIDLDGSRPPVGPILTITTPSF